MEQSNKNGITEHLKITSYKLKAIFSIISKIVQKLFYQIDPGSIGQRPVVSFFSVLPMASFEIWHQMTDERSRFSPKETPMMNAKISFSFLESHF